MVLFIFSKATKSNFIIQLAYSCKNRTQLDQATVKLRSIASARSVQSDAISRKSKYRAKAASTVAGNQSLISTFVPKTPKLGDTSKPPTIVNEPVEPSKQYLRPKNLFQGVYFPCMGSIVSGGVLSGTEIFPYSPKQEKLHFMKATRAPLGHLDGQENGAYMDSILVHMQIRTEAWEYPKRSDFLDEEGFTYHQVNRFSFEN